MQANMTSRTTPTARRPAATYSTYEEAQRAVDSLADREFPVERTAIVADGLRLVEQVTGRLSYGKAALNGAGAGALTGAIIGFIFGLFDWVSPLISGLVLALNGLVFGAIVGALFGLLTYSFTGGRRDFSSVRGMEAERYQVMVDDEVFNEAYRLLSSGSAEEAGGRVGMVPPTEAESGGRVVQ